MRRSRAARPRDGRVAAAVLTAEAWGRRVAALALAALGATAAGCTETQSALAPAGPAAGEIEALWWILFWGAGLASGLVILVLLLAVRRGHRAASPDAVFPARETRLILLAGGAFPAAIIVYFLVETVRVGARVQVPPSEPALTVDVIGHQFWWEVRYPDHGVVTANEIHVPAGRPVRLRVTAADVIHSFWVPNLHGKIDMNPGQTNAFWIHADSAGVYRGQCAEFCGLQHARMALLVVAEPPDAFESWLEEQGRAATEPAGAAGAGLQVFLERGCGFCHTVRGVHELERIGAPGPDLTHLATRRTLAAVTLENTRANLAVWIVDPQGVKPGARMPPTPLPEPELNALLDFLEGLR